MSNHRRQPASGSRDQPHSGATARAPPHHYRYRAPLPTSPPFKRHKNSTAARYLLLGARLLTGPHVPHPASLPSRLHRLTTDAFDQPHAPPAAPTFLASLRHTRPARRTTRRRAPSQPCLRSVLPCPSDRLPLRKRPRSRSVDAWAFVSFPAVPGPSSL